MSDRDQLVAVALGETPAGLVIRGGDLVNVYTGEVYRADVAVAGERIAAVGDVERCVGEGTRIVDASGKYLVPGFIETHFHVGATSLSSTELARLLVPYGTAAIVTDFTEATKLAGVRAARFFLDEANATPLKVFLSPFFTVMLPSDTRHSVSPEEFEEMLAWPETRELREWNVQSSRHASELIRNAGRHALERGLILAGHLRGQLGAALQASAAAGAASDHEAYTVEEAVERMQAGIAVQIRFGSAHWTETADLLRAVTEKRLDSSLIMFSTDEQELVDVRDLGFMDHRVRMAIEHGVAPLDAIRMGTLNPARFLRVTADYGGIAPGRMAFVNVVDDLRSFRVEKVVYRESVVAEDERFVGDLKAPTYPEEFYGTVRLKSPLAAADFAVAAPERASAKAAVRVIGFDPEVSGTKERFLDLPVSDGAVGADPGRDVVKLASVERSARSGQRGVGFIQGLGMKRGALGFTYHPGPCELALIGADDADMALVGNRIAELGGGVVVAADGKILAEAPMPLLGLVSDRPAEEVEAQLRAAKAAIASLGIDFKSNIYRLAVLFISGVAPELRMTVKGLLRVELSGARLKEYVVPVVVEERGEPANASGA